MAFGYALFQGKRGASGYCADTGEKRTVRVRGVKPGETYALYRLEGSGAILLDEQKSDRNGLVILAAGRRDAPSASLFVACGNQVVLWQGGDEMYLRTGDWLAREAERQKALAAPPPEPQIGIDEETQQALEKDLIDIQAAPPNHEGNIIVEETAPVPETQPDNPPLSKEEQPEQFSDPFVSYTLRPASGGEPVDTLPER